VPLPFFAQVKQADIQQIILNKKQTRCLSISKTGTKGETIISSFVEFFFVFSYNKNKLVEICSTNIFKSVHYTIVLFTFLFHDIQYANSKNCSERRIITNYTYIHTSKSIYSILSNKIFIFLVITVFMQIAIFSLLFLFHMN